MATLLQIADKKRFGWIKSRLFDSNVKKESFLYKFQLDPNPIYGIETSALVFPPSSEFSFVFRSLKC